MRKLIPDFIHDKHARGEDRGRFDAFTIFVDLVGFTGITDRFQKYGREGIEVVSDIITRVFNPAISAIYANGGFISTFAGDAFTGIFVTREARGPLRAASEIRENFAKMTLKTKFGVHEMAARTGLSFGPVEWRIVRNELQHAYFFRGAGLEGCARSQARSAKGAIVIDERFKRMIGKGTAGLTKIGRGYYELAAVPRSGAPARIKKRRAGFRKEILSRFVPEPVLKMREAGEFRDIVSVFISFGKVRKMDRFVNELINITRRHGGYLNKVDFGDKGGIALVLFGAPSGIEKQVQRSVEYSLDLIGSSGPAARFRIGMAGGIAYAGFLGGPLRCEYTALGEVVNLSARLSMSAPWGQVWASGDVRRDCGSGPAFKPKGKMRFKGIAGKIDVFAPRRAPAAKEADPGAALVGRSEELALLGSFIKPLQEGRFGGLVYIDGEPGIGKSSLVAEFRKRLATDTYQWFYMPCDELIRTGFNPVIHFLRGYFGQREKDARAVKKKNFERAYRRLLAGIKDPAAAGELAKAMPYLAGLTGITAYQDKLTGLEPKTQYDNTLYALKNFIKAESARKPVIVAIEDGHLLDANTADFLRALTRNVAEYPFMILLTCRPRDDGGFYRIDGLDAEAKSIRVDRLDREAASKLIEDKLAGPATLDLTEAVYRKSEGNPFFAEQMILFLRESGIVSMRDKCYGLKEKNFEIPQSVNSIIISRVDRLDRGLAEAVKVASVLGREFSGGVLSAMLAGKSASALLARGVDEGIWSATSGSKYAFKHSLIRESVYNMQLKKALRHYHRRAARTIEGLTPENLEPHWGELAYHFDSAGEKEKAKEYLGRAADDARNKYKNADAIELYEKLARYLDGRERLEIESRRASAMAAVGKWREAKEEWSRIIARAGELGCREIVADSRQALGDTISKTGGYDDALKLFFDALETYRALNKEALAGRTYESIGTTYSYLGDNEKARAYLRRALDLAVRDGDPEALYSVSGSLGNFHWDRGEFAESLAFFKKALEIAEAHNQKDKIPYVLGNLGNVHWARGDLDRAVDYYRKSLASAEAVGNLYPISNAVNGIGAFYYETGRYEQAAGYFERSVKLAREMGYNVGLCIALGNLGDVNLRRGNHRKAKELYEEQYALARKINNALQLIYARENLGNYFRALKDYGRAVEHYDQGIRLARGNNNNYFLTVILLDKARVMYALGRFNDAGSLAKEAARQAGDMQVPALCFSSALLSAKIEAKADPDRGLQALRGLLKTHDKKPESLLVEYEIYGITKDRDLGERLKKAFQDLCDEQPKSEYKEILDELG